MRKRSVLLLAVPAAVVIIAAFAIGAYSSVISRPLFDEVLNPDTLAGIEIADIDEALTFARYREDDNLQVLLVSRYQDGKVHGINLNQYFDTDEVDPILLFIANGYTKVRDAATSASEQTVVSATDLEVPFDARGPHIGIGANYRAHARESRAGEEPFVFPKIGEATRFTSGIRSHDSPRLDYEGELGFVVLEDIPDGDSFPEFMGLVLCNDFTDRWTLIRHMKRGTPMGTTGFPDGKGKKGFLPMGNLFVIPHDLEAFYPQIELYLYLNKRLRQKAKAGLMVWGPDEMIRQIHVRSDWAFYSDSGTVSLLPAGKTIRAGTIILSGTPAGVIFRPLNIWNKNLYLSPGDNVVVRAERMGIMRNAITD